MSKHDILLVGGVITVSRVFPKYVSVVVFVGVAIALALA